MSIPAWERQVTCHPPPSPPSLLSLFLSPLQSFSQPLFLSSAGRRPSDKLIHVLSGTGLSKQFKNEILSSPSLMYDTSTSVPCCLFHLIWPVGFVQTEGSCEVTWGPEEHLCKLLKVKWDTEGAEPEPLTSQLGHGGISPDIYFHNSWNHWEALFLSKSLYNKQE